MIESGVCAPYHFIVQQTHSSSLAPVRPIGCLTRLLLDRDCLCLGMTNKLNSLRLCFGYLINTYGLSRRISLDSVVKAALMQTGMEINQCD